MATWAASLFEQGVISGSVWESGQTFSLLAGADRSFSITSGDIAPILFSLQINSEVEDGLLEVFEDEAPTGGTILPLQKYNRNSADDPTIVLTDNVTFTPSTDPFKTATLIGARFSGSTFGGQVGFLLKKNSTTVFRFTNNDTGTRVSYVEIVLGESRLF